MNKKGFTLIELLVVIAIIGLLSTLAVVALSSARESARDSKRVADLKRVQTALELYYNETATYPTTTVPIELGSTNAACLNVADGFTTAGCSTALMNQVPSDPSPGQTYNYSATTSDTYIITASLEGTVSGFSGNVTFSPAGIE